MGYNTDWNGTLKTSRPFTQEELNYWKEMSEMRHDSAYGYGSPHREFPSIWCDFDVVNFNDKTGTYGVFRWNESEKTYEGKKWIKFFLNWVSKFEIPMYVKGILEWRGDEEDDAGAMVVEYDVKDGITQHKLHEEEVVYEYNRIGTEIL